MLELFRRMWLGWNVLVRKIVSAQTTILMTVTWLVAIAPVAVWLKIVGTKLIDRAPPTPGAASYGNKRAGTPLDMDGASRMF